MSLEIFGDGFRNVVHECDQFVASSLEADGARLGWIADDWRGLQPNKNPRHLAHKVTAFANIVSLIRISCRRSTTDLTRAESGEITVESIWPNTVYYIYRVRTKQQTTGENPRNKRVMSHTLHQHFRRRQPPFLYAQCGRCSSDV